MFQSISGNSSSSSYSSCSSSFSNISLQSKTALVYFINSQTSMQKTAKLIMITSIKIFSWNEIFSLPLNSGSEDALTDAVTLLVDGDPVDGI